MSDSALLVIAKAPVPGRSKTRLCPPCTPREAARLAQAALADTLATVAATPAARRVLVLDGAPGPWLHPGFDLVAQRGAGLGERLAAAFADVPAPALLVGMDTPQLTAELLTEGLDALRAGARSVFGLAEDGGYWAIGLQNANPAVFANVPMSRADTGFVQRARLEALDLAPVMLPVLRDVDVIADARAVAALAPDGRFAGALAELDGPARTLAA